MGHLDSQRSLPAIKPEGDTVSTLARKLRLAAGQTAAVLNAPEAYLAMLQPAPAEIKTRLDPGRAYDVVVLFVRNTEELRRFGSAAVRATSANGMLWIAYPKGGKTRAATDLPATPWWVKNDVLGDITAEKGYKPVSLVSIDQDLTALRFKKL
jgi:hypothetical protein